MQMRKWIGRIVPERAWLPLIFELMFNSLVYSGAKMIAGNWHHYNIETSLDLKLPFVPWTVAIYFGCYLFWAVNYVLAVRADEKDAWRFLSADFLSKCVCLVCFLLFPTTNTRPEFVVNTFWDWAMKLLYQIDAADNLFPSIHCLVSWFCYIGVRRQKNIPHWYRIFSCLFALAVFVSTLTTKQHVLVDVLGGYLLAEGCWFITAKSGFARKYEQVFHRINTALRLN